MALALTASYEVDSAAVNTATLTTPSFTPANGEVIVVKVATEEAPTIGTPSGGSLTYTSRVSNTTASTSSANIFTSIVSGSPGSMTVAVTFTGSTGWHSMVVERWTGGTLAGTPAVNSTKLGTGAPSTTLTTVGTNSVVSWVDADWNAVAPGTPAYRSSATQDGLHNKSTGNYVAYYAYQTAATAGSQTFGLTAPTGQKWTLLGVEIQLAASPDATVTAGNVAGATTITAPVVSGAAAATPSSVSGVVTMTSPVAAGAATVTAGNVAGGTTVPTPTVSSPGGPTSITSVAGQATITAPTVSGAASKTTTAVAGTTTISTPTVSTGGSGHAAHLFTTQTPQSTGSDAQVVVGMVFTTDTSAACTGARYYKFDTRYDGLDIEIGVFDDTAGTTLASATRTQSSGDPVGWIDVPFSSPPTLATSTNYNVAFITPGGTGYSFTASELATGIDNVPLHSPATAGRFTYTAALQRPTNTTTTNFYVDVTLDAVSPNATIAPPNIAGHVTMTAPAVAVGSAVAATSVAGQATVPTPGVGHNVTVTPTSVAVQAGIASMVGAQSSTADPGGIVGGTTVATPTGTAGVAVSPATVMATSKVTTPTLAGFGSFGIWSWWDGITETSVLVDGWFNGVNVVGIVYAGMWNGSVIE